MQRIAVIGNCQAAPLATLLRRLRPMDEIIAVDPVHSITQARVQQLHESLPSFDVVITQPVAPGYRDGIGIDTPSVEGHIRRDAALMRIPNVHFEGLFPTWGYMRYGNGLLRGPLPLVGDVSEEETARIRVLQKSDYQCFLLLCAYLEEVEPAQVASLISMSFDEPAIRDWYSASLDEFEQRERVCDTTMTPVLRNISSHADVGFHSFNHPNTALLARLAVQVANRLAEAAADDRVWSVEDAQREFAGEPDPLSRITLPVYGFVSRSLAMAAAPVALTIEREVMDVTALVQRYFEYYRRLERRLLAENVGHKKLYLARTILDAHL